MKIRLSALATLLVLLSFHAKAQDLKIGYVKLEKVFAEWPETRNANTELKDYEKALNSRLQAKVKDFQTKYASYQETGTSLDAATRRDTEVELQNLQTQIQQFEANAQQSVAEKNASLLKPLQKKLSDTIEQVAKENGYTHILTYGSAVVYTSDKSGDISSRVAQKLGFTLTPDTP